MITDESEQLHGVSVQILSQTLTVLTLDDIQHHIHCISFLRAEISVMLSILNCSRSNITDVYTHSGTCSCMIRLELLQPLRAGVHNGTAVGGLYWG